MDKLVRSRAGYKGVITTMKDKYKTVDKNNRLELVTMRQNFIVNLDKVNDLNEKIYDEITEEGKLKDEMVKANDYSFEINKILYELDEAIKK